MLGANPGIAPFAAALLVLAPENVDFQRYLTGATTAMDFSGTNWALLGAGSGDLCELVTPRALQGVA